MPVLYIITVILYYYVYHVKENKFCWYNFVSTSAVTNKRHYVSRGTLRVIKGAEFMVNRNSFLTSNRIFYRFF
jgi:hypothetical protein